MVPQHEVVIRARFLLASFPMLSNPKLISNALRA